MKIPEFKNAKFSGNTDAIDCEINHPQYGWIPFTCAQNDNGAEFDTSTLYALLLASSPQLFVEPEFSDLQLAEMIRNKRNALLSASEWTQMPDAPDTLKTEWRVYRDALRNIPQQESFPKSVTWPESPQRDQII